MTMGGGMNIPITIKARDEASATMGKIGKQAGNLNRQIGQSGKSANTAGLGMMGLSRGLFFMSKVFGPLLGGAGLAGAAKHFDSLQKKGVALEIGLAALGTSAQQTFAAFQEADTFKELGARYKWATNDVEQALFTLMKTSGQTDIQMETLQATLAAAKIHNLELEDAAKMVGNAMKGNIDPIRELFGDTGFQGLEKHMADWIARGDDAITFVDTFTNKVSEAWDDVMGGGWLESMKKDRDASGAGQVSLLGGPSDRQVMSMAESGYNPNAFANTPKALGRWSSSVDMGGGGAGGGGVNIQTLIVDDESRQRETVNKFKDLLVDADRGHLF